MVVLRKKVDDRMRKIISRYILKEIASLFFIILFVLTFVLLMGNILQMMDLMVNKGISFFSIAKVIIFLLPNLLMFTIPIALLVSTLIAMGRFSADNEITALKTSGVSLMQLYYPVAIASLVSFIITFVIGYYLVPHSYSAFRHLLFDIAQQHATIGIKEKVFNDDFKGILIYADKIPARENYIEGVLVSDNRVLPEQNTILAKKASIIADSTSMILTLRLENGSIHTVSSDFKKYRKIDFKNYDINLDLSTEIDSAKNKSKTKDEMTVNELLEVLKKPGINKVAQREYAIEVHKKFSIPLSCVIFVLLAVPLGIRSHRTVKSRGLTIGIIIATSYYLVRIGGESLVETGRLSPEIGVWTPNFIFALLGIYLFYMAYREISLLHMIKIKLRSIFQKIRD
jgi:lipopolysaccharide export system permease protein